MSDGTKKGTFLIFGKKIRNVPFFLLLASALVRPAAAESIAFVGVKLIPMDAERVLEDQTVIVRDRRIERIGHRGDIEVGDHLQTVAGEGHYLMPGLSEMHAHVPAGDRAYLERVLFLYVANGITTVRGMLGEPSHLDLRRAIADGRIVGPRLYTSGPSFNAQSVDDPDAAVAMARDQERAGYDFLKIHPGLTRAEFEALASVANELHMPFAGHVSTSVGLQGALAAGQASIDHLDSYMQALVPGNATVQMDAGFFGFELAGDAAEARIAAVARQTAAADVWNVPTQTLIENLVLPVDAEEMRRRPELRYMPPDTVDQWAAAKRQFLADPGYDSEQARRYVELRRVLILALHEAGAGILLGSDAPQVFNVPGFSAHRELGLLVAAGLTPYEALRAGTAAPARFFGAADTFGIIAEGLEADLVLLEANPLEDIANASRIAGVMLRGRWLPREAIDARLRELDFAGN
ncbi:MAG: amidohydrolase family protein [Gammaproteobacteria bacterium]|nr:amidohydrolase family protein [Gammaproteobacteria bacterium]